MYKEGKGKGNLKLVSSKDYFSWETCCWRPKGMEPICEDEDEEDEKEGKGGEEKEDLTVYELRGGRDRFAIRQLRSEGLSFQIWPAASVLCRFFEDLFVAPPGMFVEMPLSSPPSSLLCRLLATASVDCRRGVAFVANGSRNPPLPPPGSVAEGEEEDGEVNSCRGDGFTSQSDGMSSSGISSDGEEYGGKETVVAIFAGTLRGGKDGDEKGGASRKDDGSGSVATAKRGDRLALKSGRTSSNGEDGKETVVKLDLAASNGKDGEKKGPLSKGEGGGVVMVKRVNGFALQSDRISSNGEETMAMFVGTSSDRKDGEEKGASGKDEGGVATSDRGDGFALKIDITLSNGVETKVKLNGIVSDGKYGEEKGAASKGEGDVVMAKRGDGFASQSDGILSDGEEDGKETMVRFVGTLRDGKNGEEKNTSSKYDGGVAISERGDGFALKIDITLSNGVEMKARLNGIVSDGKYREEKGAASKGEGDVVMAKRGDGFASQSDGILSDGEEDGKETMVRFVGTLRNGKNGEEKNTSSKYDGGVAISERGDGFAIKTDITLSNGVETKAKLNGIASDGKDGEEKGALSKGEGGVVMAKRLDGFASQSDRILSDGEEDSKEIMVRFVGTLSNGKNGEEKNTSSKYDGGVAISERGDGFALKSDRSSSNGEDDIAMMVKFDGIASDGKDDEEKGASSKGESGVAMAERGDGFALQSDEILSNGEKNGKETMVKFIGIASNGKYGEEKGTLSKGEGGVAMAERGDGLALKSNGTSSNGEEDGKETMVIFSGIASGGKDGEEKGALGKGEGGVAMAERGDGFALKSDKTLSNGEENGEERIVKFDKIVCDGKDGEEIGALNGVECGVALAERGDGFALKSNGTLSKELNSLPRRIRVLELGSGTGMVGILAAILGGEVVITDLPHVLPNLLHNANLNAGSIRASGRGGTLHVHPLCWGNSDDAHRIMAAFPPGFDLILASDVVYYDSLFEPLLQTLKFLLLDSPSHPPLLLAHVRRWKKDSVFFRKANKLFDVRVLCKLPHPANARTGVTLYCMSLRKDTL